MKREETKMIIVYILIFVVMVLIVLLTKLVLDQNKTNEPEPKEEPVVTSVFPTVNDECTFSLSTSQYNQLTQAGCANGYTRYDINNVILDGITLPVTVIFSDTDQTKTGLYVNEKRVIKTLSGVDKYKFGIFDRKLLIHDKNNNESNVLAFDGDGKQVYNLKEVLTDNEVKDLSDGTSNISTKTLDTNSFVFTEGAFEFNSFTNDCSNGEKSKGSHYKVVYKDNKFELPEFMNLINCQ